ncbi:hypothetical protein PCS_00234 [Desulfocurvibacter africanus PCS]|uniref:Heavy-metal resistance n=1 Tax=Desulfocurvibacter africanus PCS TaxID=1262666 RepID=M5PX24_DESAF|nr:hypothetical protein [Desulfocurvibacter africanus]EMG38604.1 hypothetical protein PCS_00234 [Desulfocurvibacter africanus PCS]
MRKTFLALALALTFGLIGTQAQAYYGCPMGGAYGVNPAVSADYQKFMTETSQLRADLYAAQAALNAQLAQPKPDQAKVRELTRNVADKQSELALKARAYNVNGYGYACPGHAGGYHATTCAYGYGW